MSHVDINYLAVVIAAVINMVVGAAWYSTALFAGPWSKMVGRKVEDMRREAGTGYVLSALGALVQAFILAHFVAYVAYFYPDYSALTVGLWTGLLAWVAFVAVPQGVNTVFAGTRKKLWAINTGYFLVVLVINGILLAIWK
jgi:hypothetical protein